MSSSTSRSSRRSRRAFQVRSNERTHSWIGCSAGPLTRYQRWRPSARTSTRPTARSTPRCLDTCGWVRPSRSTSSPTVTSPVPMASRRSRRLASATALNASAVVAVRAMAPSYSDIGICQGGFLVSDHGRGTFDRSRKSTRTRSREDMRARRLCARELGRRARGGSGRVGGRSGRLRLGREAARVGSGGDRGGSGSGERRLGSGGTTDAGQARSRTKSKVVESSPCSSGSNVVTSELRTPKTASSSRYSLSASNTWVMSSL